MVDHVSGSRRGQRQEFELVDRLRFGRHPDNEVSFDAHRDLDASSRHAELRRSGDGYLLCDVGSSNGTFVGDERITEKALGIGEPLTVEFGVGGPRLRICIGSADTIAALPKIAPEDGASRWLGVIAALVVLIAAVIVAIWWRFAG